MTCIATDIYRHTGIHAGKIRQASQTKRQTDGCWIQRVSNILQTQQRKHFSFLSSFKANKTFCRVVSHWIIFCNAVLCLIFQRMKQDTADSVVWNPRSDICLVWWAQKRWVTANCVTTLCRLSDKARYDTFQRRWVYGASMFLQTNRPMIIDVVNNT